MNKSKSQKDKFLLILAFGFIILSPLVAWFSFNYLNSQQRNMRAVDQYLLKIEPIIEMRAVEEPFFKTIDLATFTAENGSLMVNGTVKDEDERERIREFFLQYPPPRPLVFDVRIESKADLQP